MHIHSLFTVFFLPIANSLGLSHAQTALPFALARAESGITGPIAGWLIDKYGVKPLMFTGTIFTGIGYILLARTNSFLTFLLVYVFVISLVAGNTYDAFEGGRIKFLLEPTIYIFLFVQAFFGLKYIFQRLSNQSEKS